MLKRATYLRMALLTGASLACISAVNAQETTDDQDELRQESVVVRGQFIPDEKRSTSEVSSLIDADDFQVSGDADAASALSRVAGISTSEDARFVYVRGLNERYSGATLNGSPLPSPEPLRRVAPLDLFPTAVLRSILVQKTFSPDMPGEFGGGLVDIRTKTVPDEAFFEVSASTGGDTQATFQDGLLYDGGDLDFLGVSDNKRTMPTLPAAGEPDADFARALTNDSSLLIMQEGTVSPDFSLEATGGQRFDLNEDISLGLLAAASYSNSWTTKEGTRGLASAAGDGGLAVESSQEFLSTENSINVNGFATVGLDLYDNHEVRGTAFVVRSTDKEARSSIGDSIEGNLQRNDNLEWFERQLWTTQISGEHFFPALMDLSVEWRASYSEAQRDAPYQFSITYQDTGNGFQTLQDDQATTFTFSTIDDDSTDFGIDLELPLVREGECFLFCDTQLKAGYAYTENDRLATSRIFTIAGLGVSDTRIDYLAASQYALGELNSNSIGGNQFPEQYVATLEVDAAHAGIDTQITPFLRGAIGVRYERAIEAIDTRTVSTPDTSPPFESCIDFEPGEGCDYEYDLLPAATITWNPLDDLQVRAGYSETLTRPQFRELAPTEFLNTETDVTFQGNPFLVNAAIENYDLRGEYYFGREQFVTLGLFYKEMERPIEEVNRRLGDDAITTFLNVPSAELFGAEFEYEQVLPFYDMLNMDFFRDRDITVKANYTWSDSEVSAGRDPNDLGLSSAEFCAQFPDECITLSIIDGTSSIAQVLPAVGQMEDGRRLQGQSEHLFNLQLVYTDADAGTEANLLLNYASDRIRSGEDVGLNIPAIIEEPPTSLDFILNQQFGFRGGDYEFSLKLRNLLGDDYEAYSERGGDRIDADTYDIGTSISLGLKRRF